MGRWVIGGPPSPHLFRDGRRVTEAKALCQPDSPKQVHFADSPLRQPNNQGIRIPHFLIKAAGYETLITHVFRNGDQYLDSDAVFGVRSSLVADWVRHEPGTAPDDTRMDVPFFTLDFDFVLNPISNEK